MDASILHITNGDSTTNYLKQLNIQGDFITWREMLCEGKSEGNVGTEKFWKSRFHFLKNSYNFNKRHFIDFTLKEYRKLCKQKAQDDIVLWFENDLFSQINMLGLLSWLHRYRKGRNISLVSNSSIKKANRSFQFSQISEKKIKHHYTHKLALSQDDMAYADYVWQLYCSKDPILLQHVHQYKPSKRLDNLTACIVSHLQRFPSLDNGLNVIENEIVTAASNHAFTCKNKFVESILQNKNLYRFGDLRYTNKIDNLHPFFHSFSPVILNIQGKKVQQKIINAYANLRNDYSFLGGAKKYNYLYDNSTQKLLKITSL